MKQYFINILLGLDQLINTIFNGEPDESLSSRAYRMYAKGKNKWVMKTIDLIFFWQHEHCKQAYESEVDRRQLPPEFRSK